MKTLNELAVSIGLEALPSSGDLPIAELCMDSRKQEDGGSDGGTPGIPFGHACLFGHSVFLLRKWFDA